MNSITANIGQVRCCVAGGGPAGMMLGYLLARAGVDVVVLEKHLDFLRDFRGDTIHPSTLDLLDELNILEDFLKRPHNEVRELRAQFGDEEVIVSDFSHLPTRCKFIALMPQWDFLNFLSEKAAAYPTFRLQMQAEVQDLLEENGRITGVSVKTPKGIQKIFADLVIGADGRHSVVRERAGLLVKDLGAPMDVLWLRISRHAGDPEQTLGRFDRGKIMVMLKRESYWQCGYVIAKGAFDDIQARGLAAFREDITKIAPFVRDRVGEIRDWNDIKLLTVVVDRLYRWFRPGLLCIGDSAHAMSPIGGVGINLAIQDAVAAANILAVPLREVRITIDDIKRVQKRREFPTRMIQRLQVLIQNRAISRGLGLTENPPLPLILRFLRAWPVLRRIPARLVGVGFRPEHIKTPEVSGAGKI